MHIEIGASWQTVVSLQTLQEMRTSIKYCPSAEFQIKLDLISNKICTYFLKSS